MYIVQQRKKRKSYFTTSKIKNHRNTTTHPSLPFSENFPCKQNINQTELF